MLGMEIAGEDINRFDQTYEPNCYSSDCEASGHSDA